MDDTWLNHVKQALIVSYHYRACLVCMKHVYAICHNAHCIYVKTRIGLVEYGESRLKHSHLEYLVTLLLAAREALVYRAVGKLCVELNNLTLCFHQFDELGSRERGKSLILSLFIDSSLHEVCHRDTRNLHRILEREEKALMSTILRLHLKQVLAIIPNLAFSNLVERITNENGTKS